MFKKTSIFVLTFFLITLFIVLVFRTGKNKIYAVSELDPRIYSIITKFVQGMENYDAEHSLYDSEGTVDLDGDGSIDTFNQVEDRCWEQDATLCAAEKVKVIAGNPPLTKKPDSTSMTQHLENWAQYRLDSAIWHHTLTDYHIFKYEISEESAKTWHMERIAPHAYHTLLDLDVLMTGPEHVMPLAGLKDYENNKSPCRYLDGEECVFDTRTIYNNIESITIGTKMYNWEMNAREWTVVLVDLASDPHYSNDPNAPCYGKAEGNCVFDSRSLFKINFETVHELEDITIGPSSYTYDRTTGEWWNYIPDLTTVERFNENPNTPCYGKSAGTCTFDTWDFLYEDGQLTEKITVGSKLYTTIINTNPYTYEILDVVILTGDPKYSQDENSPCFEKSDCAFSTIALSQDIESVTVGSKAYNYNFITQEWGPFISDLGGVEKYKQGDSIYTLRDTKHTERYASDATGIFTGLIELYEKGLIPETYCTSIEKPYDEGKNCKTVNLHERLKIIFSCLMAHSEIHWMYDDEIATGSPTDRLRKKYYDLNNLIDNPGSFVLTPNINTDYGQGIGRLDLAGRSCHVLPENINIVSNGTYTPDRFFYNGQMVTLLFMSTFFKNHFPEAYPSNDIDRIIKFTQNAIAHEKAINLENDGDVVGYNFDDSVDKKEFIQYNEFGYPVRDDDDYSNLGCGGGTLVGGWSNPNENLPDCVGGTKELLGYEIVRDQPGWQYLMQATESLDWDWSNSPGGDTELKKNIPYLKHTMQQTYFVDGESMVILDPSHRYAGSFNLELIETIMPGKLGECYQEGDFYYRKTTGNLAHECVGAVTSLEPLLTISSGVYAVLKQFGENEEADWVLNISNQLLDTYVANTPHPSDNLECWRGNVFVSNRSKAQEVARHLAYYRVGLYYWLDYTGTSLEDFEITPAILGDINGDDVVNIQDYVLLSNAFGTGNEAADLNNDGIVNIQDFIILSNNFGKTN